MAVKKLIAAAVFVTTLSGLGGCVYPGYYGRGYYGPPPAAVVIAPHPYYWRY